MDDTMMENPQRFDTIVVGAGPAGCEAALAAARRGAEVLCLTINLDTVGFPPANPVIVEGPDDNRRDLLAEIDALGGALPRLLQRENVGRELPGGIIVADRRNLGLAYKELLENTNGLHMRQTLVTALEPAGSGWHVTTRLDESFQADSVVVAAGTFIAGEVSDGGHVSGGGRLGEIPAKALARSLQSLGIEMVTVKSMNMPRIDGAKHLTGEPVSTVGDYRMLPDGSQLGERYLFGPFILGTHAEQLATVRRAIGVNDAWMTRAAWGLTSLGLAGGQVDTGLESLAHTGLFFAGRAAASCNYTEAAASGLVAGNGAAASATGGGGVNLIESHKFVNKLCDAIAHRTDRPVTVRIEGPGC